MADDASNRTGLTGPQFEALCVLIWGPQGWRAQAASALRVSARNVDYFAAGSRPIPYGIADELAAEVVERLARDPGERERMTAWLARHDDQGAVMRAALGLAAGQDSAAVGSAPQASAVSGGPPKI